MPTPINEINRPEKPSVAYSILDLAIVSQGRTIQQTLHDSLALAQEAEAHGYQRYWLAEHHNSDNIGSSATSLLIGYVAEKNGHHPRGLGRHHAA
jgi:hypothetical protein